MSTRVKMPGNNEIKISLGLSPCPNDTFIFHALLNGLATPRGNEKLRFEPLLADVEKLNNMALEEELEVSKISVGVLPHILAKYRVLSSGAALGWGCGPLVVAKKQLSPQEMARAVVAIPGKMTTANMLLGLHDGFKGERREMLFSDVMDAVANGEADAGVIIHECRFTYQALGLVKLLDLGEWWEANYNMPLPLGAIVIRRDVPLERAKAIEDAIAASLRYAWQNPQASAEFIRENAREMDPEVTKAHIRTFVTSYSEELGETGRNAIRTLIRQGRGYGERSGEDIFLGLSNWKLKSPGGIASPGAKV